MVRQHTAYRVSLLWIILSLGYVSSADHGKGKYLGCYKDEGNPRSFVGHVEHFGTDLTPQKCTEVCYKKGFLYAATQARMFCFCNDKHPNPNAKASEDRCSRPCSGNPVEKCGGDNSLSVTRTGIPDYSEVTQYVGCYYNIYGILNGVSLNYEKTNSPRRCMNACLQMGYKYAGVQNSRECHCGNQQPSVEQTVSGDECEWPCPGDPSGSCGGNVRIAIYTTTASGGSARPKKKRFHVENEKTANWHEALMACARNKTRLASIDSVEELDEIKRAIRRIGRGMGQFWTSGSDEGSEGDFLWATTGEHISSTSDWWLTEPHHRQPDNWEGVENCVEVWERYEWQGYGLNDRPCGEKIYYICESYIE